MMTDVLVLGSRRREVGNSQVRRLLPAAKKQAVGPFLFFDHFGPEERALSSKSDVRPHPHIGLSTVTYLFEGRLVHRDSIGSVQAIEPGAINWMTAGRGVAHSERARKSSWASGAARTGCSSGPACRNPVRTANRALPIRREARFRKKSTKASAFAS